MNPWMWMWLSVASAGAPATWTVLWENDSVWSLMWNNPYRDEFYTNGSAIRRSQWVAGHTDQGLGRASQVMASALRLGDAEGVRFGLAQTMYTPVDFWLPMEFPTDHPWAAHLHFTGGLSAVRAGLRSSVELLGGWTGPPALGEPLQTNFHAVFGGDVPMGWRHQVRFEPTVGAAVGLSVIELGTWTDGLVELRAVPTVLAVAATTDLAAEVGGLVGIGTAGDVPAVRPEEARFGHSALDGHVRGDSVVGVAIYAFADARLVSHDMFVSGGTFTAIDAPAAEGAISESGLGVTVRFHATRFTLVNNYQTRVFVGQPYDHVYGTMSVSQDLGVQKNRGQ